MVGLHEQIETALSGGYQIERELGRGGMAIVYLARDLKHSRRVAVKVLRPELATSLGAERFLREINVAAGLSHPNIVPLYDSGEADDLLYYVMPYVEGESLRDRLERERQLPIDEAIGIARQVASALDCAHAKGVVHRDIKPENILLRGGQVLVADFGLARALYTASSSRLTGSGMAVGTPAYMSPEQASGDSHVDGRTDVYGLACVLFEMIAGVPPFRGATAQAVIAHHVATAPPSLCGERRSCPQALDAAVRRAMAKVPADRFRTAGEFLRAGERASLSEPERAYASFRSKWLATGVAAATTVLFAGIVVLSANWFEDPQRALSRGMTALERGDLGQARDEFRKAARAGLANANLPLAEALLLLGHDSTAEWNRAVATLPAIVPTLGATQRRRAQALASLGVGSYPSACAAFRVMLAADAHDVSTAVGLVDCIAKDSAVVPDSRTASGWRFRAEYVEAIRAGERVLAQLPLAHGARAPLFRRLSGMFFTEPGQVRRGFAVDDRAVRFAAYPLLTSDSGGQFVTFVPFRMADLAGRSAAGAAHSDEAIAFGQRQWRDLALAWAAESPDSYDALSALAHALEATGEIAVRGQGRVSALDAVRRARSLTRVPLQQIRLVRAEIRLLIKQSEFEGARALADSALARWPRPGVPEGGGLAIVAALVGNAHRTAELLRRTAPEFVVTLPSGRPFHPHPDLGATAQALLGYASLGLHVDSIKVLRARLERQLQSYVSPDQRDEVRIGLLARPLSLAVPSLGADIAATLPDDAGSLLQLQRALARGDTNAVRSGLDSAYRMRRGLSAGGTTLDRTYQEAWLRVAIGDTAGAIDQLELPLSALATWRSSVLRTVPEAAAVVRVMRLRADLASQAGDTASARKWGRAAEIMWGGLPPRA